MVIKGYTGNSGYGDAFEVTGEIISFERTGDDADVRLVLDGDDVTDQYLDEG